MPVPFTNFLSLYSVLPFLPPHLSFFYQPSLPPLSSLFPFPLLTPQVIKLSSMYLFSFFFLYFFSMSSCFCLFGTYYIFICILPICLLFIPVCSSFFLFSPSLTAPRCSILCHFFFYPRVLTSYHSTLFSTQSLLAPSFLWPLCVSFPPFLTLLFPCFLPSQQWVKSQMSSCHVSKKHFSLQIV